MERCVEALVSRPLRAGAAAPGALRAAPACSPTAPAERGRRGSGGAWATEARQRPTAMSSEEKEKQALLARLAGAAV